jgi:hypothetical protein
MTATDTVQHYTYDKLYPKEFQVYPPNDGNGTLEALVSKEFTRVTALGTIIPVDDIYIPAMTDYLLYRAYSKHSKFAGNEQRATNAYSRFGQALGIQIQQEAATDPNQTNKSPQSGVE